MGSGGPAPGGGAVTAGGGRSNGALRVSVDVSAVPSEPAGAGRYTLDLVATLAGRDDLVLHLIARAGDEDRWTAMGPAVTVHAEVPRPRPLRLAWEQARLPQLLSRLAVDVHHSPHYTMPESADVPRVVTVHDLTFYDHPEWHQRSKVAVFRRAIRVAARHAEGLVCVSEATARRLARVCGYRGDMRVIPHGVALDRFRPAEQVPAADDEATLAALGVRRPYVGFVGTLEPRKDVPTLVRAFDRVAAAHGDLLLVLAGTGGWGTEAVEAAIASATHGDRVLRPGYVPDEVVPALLRQAAAVAYPSLEEGFGIPALEALACGAPLVTTKGSAMEEVAGGAALLFPPGDAAALAGALDMLVRGDASLDVRRRRGLAIAARHTWPASASAHVELYRAVAAKGRAT
jgi:glycosyltransferase involved in cell wall biosynthesis